MKIQIRRGVFETNSSSVHTLSISKDKDILSKVKNISEIVFEQDSTFYSHSNNDVQIKINEIMEYVLSDNDLSKFINSTNKIKRCLDSVGISCKFNLNENTDYYCYCENRDVFDELFDEDDETFTFLFLNFLFNDLSYTDIFDRDIFDIKINLDSSLKNYVSY